jgi:hypothetical protein
MSITRLLCKSQSRSNSPQTLPNTFRNDAFMRRMQNSDSPSVEENENASLRTVRHSFGEELVRFVNRQSKRKSKRSRNPQSNGNAKHQRVSTARQRSLAVLRGMRTNGDSLAAASKEQNIDPRTVRKYVGNEMKQSSNGKYEAKKTDRLTRKMIAPSSYGMESITVRGSKQASELGKYLAAVGDYLRTGNSKGVQKFKGKKIGNQKLITDLATLRTLAQAGALQLEDIYAATGVS